MTSTICSRSDWRGRAHRCAGCRQPDGAVPTPDATVQEELGDVSREIFSTSRRRAIRKPPRISLTICGSTRSGRQLCRPSMNYRVEPRAPLLEAS